MRRVMEDSIIATKGRGEREEREPRRRRGNGGISLKSSFRWTSRLFSILITLFRPRANLSIALHSVSLRSTFVFDPSNSNPSTIFSHSRPRRFVSFKCLQTLYIYPRQFSTDPSYLAVPFFLFASTACLFSFPNYPRSLFDRAPHSFHPLPCIPLPFEPYSQSYRYSSSTLLSQTSLSKLLQFSFTSLFRTSICNFDSISSLCPFRGRSLPELRDCL